MFRESDYEYPKPHPTFSMKPKPGLQQVAQNMKFETYKDSVDVSEQPIIPTTFDVKYSPEDPRADWAGFVDRNHKEKKHAGNHISQQTSLVITENGVIGKDEQQQWPRINRDAAPHRNRSNQDIIGGINPNPEETFLTSYQRFVKGDETRMDQMSLMKQPAHRRQLANPAESYRNESSAASAVLGPTISSQSYQQINRPTVAPSKSFLSNIGSSIVDRVPDKPRPINKENLIPADPLPGYTGFRTKRSSK